MKVPFKHMLPAAVVATALGALSIGALAQQAPQAPAAPEARTLGHDTAHNPANNPAERAQRLQQRMAEHQARLKASLQLTPAQEPAWNAFVARLQPAQRPAQPAMDREAWQQLSTPQRLDRLEALKAERDRAMAQRHDAIRSFYAQLTPAQQKAFDAQHGFMRSGMKHHRGHGQHPQHGHGQPRS